MALTIYHNPRCTKSRQALDIIRQAGVEPTVVEYLKAPLDEAAIEKLLGILRLEPIDVIRRGEPLFKESGLASKSGDRAALIRAIAQNPILLERPIIVSGNRAVIGRPPETVKTLL